jgi:hypothetical protein
MTGVSRQRWCQRVIKKTLENESQRRNCVREGKGVREMKSRMTQGDR